MDNTLICISERIRDLRKQRGLTQDALSEKADINYSYLASVERGERSPSIRHLIKIANSLGVSLYELFLIDNHDDCSNDEMLMLHELKSLFYRIDKADRNLAMNILQQIADHK
jgi:XRE family transcriptional regulator, regulator of sulfur utilization